MVIPIHGDAPWVLKSLESVVNQVYPNVELVIVFDRVSKETESSVNDFCRSLPIRIQIQKSAEPGIVAALNLGVDVSNGDLIARLDSDDVMLPERLSLQTEAFLKDPELVVVGSQVKFISSSDELIGQSVYPVTDDDLRFHFLYRNPIAHPSVVFKRDVFLKVGGYRQFSEGAEDYDLWIRMSQHGSICNLRKSLTCYRRSSYQVTAKNHGKQIYLDSIVRIENQDQILSSTVGTFLMQEELKKAVSTIDVRRLHRDLLHLTKQKSRKNYCDLTSSDFVNKALRIKKAKSPLINLMGLTYLFLAFLYNPFKSLRLLSSMFYLKKASTNEN